MKHLGDITKINGAAVEPVEVIIGGSPCQDLSVAGKREGLSGERSGLFMEQIRIIKEMREHDRQNGATHIRPRYMVWENVPGAFSSNKGEDFRIVLEETARVVEPTAVIPRPENKWTNAGAIVGDGRSIAWRIHDAQFWGVPQRRRRIALVADFGGATAPEILFERKGVFGDITQSATPWKDFAVAIAKRFEKSDCVADNVQHVVYDARGNGDGKTGDHENRVTDYSALAVGFPLGFRPENVRTYNETATTICNGKRPGFCNGVFIKQAIGKHKQGDVASCLSARDFKSATDLVCSHTVRRLTPLECERLQGFPDGWTNIGDYTDTNGKKRKTSDSARYKALGNSIALPSWAWLLERLNRYCNEHTMASLFDGIGGFPLIWEMLNGEGSCVWASEIEEFCIAVTKYHFGEN